MRLSGLSGESLPSRCLRIELWSIGHSAGGADVRTAPAADCDSSERKDEALAELDEAKPALAGSRSDPS